MQRRELLGPRVERRAHSAALDTTSDPAASVFAEIATFFAGWVTVGLLLAFLLVRRGHDARAMTALGIGLGPILVALLTDRTGHRAPIIIRVGVDDERGRLDVLIALTGDPDHLEELEPTLRSLHGLTRRTAIATTVPYESCEPDKPDPAWRDATRRLLEASDHVAPLTPHLVVLAGRPDVAVARLARAEHVALILYAGPASSGRHARRSGARPLSPVTRARRRLGRAPHRQ